MRKKLSPCVKYIIHASNEKKFPVLDTVKVAKEFAIKNREEYVEFLTDADLEHSKYSLLEFAKDHDDFVEFQDNWIELEK